MPIHTRALFAALALCAFAIPFQHAAAASGEGLDGEWRNTNNTVHLRVERCGDAFCGIVIWAIEKARDDARRGSGEDLVGSKLLRDIKPGGDGKWHGKVFVPDINSTAAATITRVDNDTLLVSGCAFLGLACKAQHWWRLH